MAALIKQFRYLQTSITYLIFIRFWSTSFFPFIDSLWFGIVYTTIKEGKRKVQGVPQSETAALPRHQEEKETDKSKQAQIEQTYEKH